MISVVIPVRDGRESLGRCLEALGRQSVPHEVVVVDDGSEDDSAEIAEGYGVRVVRQSKKGAAAARNRGIQEARGDVVVFTDADCIAGESWLERLSQPLLKGTTGSVGRCESNQTHWLAWLIQLELDERYERMAQRRHIDFLNTGNCAFRRDLLLANPFDENFRWLEDVELSFRLAHNGNRMVFVPEARVEHKHPESLWRYIRRKFMYAGNAFRVYRRFPGKTLSDSSTPQYRRLQLILLSLAFPALLVSWLVAAAFLAASLVFSMPLVVKAFGSSFKLGLLSPLFVLSGNLAFLAGALVGLVRSLPRIYTDWFA